MLYGHIKLQNSIYKLHNSHNFGQILGMRIKTQTIGHFDIGR